MRCFVCLEKGGMTDACPCTTSVHALCLGKFLGRGFRPRCPTCFAPFTTSALVGATEAIYAAVPTMVNLLELASLRSTVGLPLQALDLLKGAAPEPEHAMAYNVETAHALLVMGKSQRALCILGRTLAVLFAMESPGARVFVHALILTAQAHMHQGEHQLAEGALTVALNIASDGDLPPDDCLDIMDSIKNMHAAQGDVKRNLAALLTIYQITKVAEKDPFIIAKAHAEWLLASVKAHSESAEVAAPYFAQDIKILRRRSPSDELLLKLGSALGGRPSKRLRQKSHPEDA